jgi:hypothetical protein
MSQLAHVARREAAPGAALEPVAPSHRQAPGDRRFPFAMERIETRNDARVAAAVEVTVESEQPLDGLMARRGRLAKQGNDGVGR